MLHAGFFNSTLTACCGGGGPYNFNNSARCGHIGSKACNNPSAYVNWDGIHLTEASYRHIAKGLISGLFSTPPLSSPLWDSPEHISMLGTRKWLNQEKTKFHWRFFVPTCLSTWLYLVGGLKVSLFSLVRH